MPSLALALSPFVCGFLAATSFAQSNELVDQHAATGGAGFRKASVARVSADGTQVAFLSRSTFFPSAENGSQDAFVRDRIAQSLYLASSSSNGFGAEIISVDLAYSANGRFVAFQSGAYNLVANDQNGAQDIFVKDIWTDECTRVSVTSTDQELSKRSTQPSISADGRYVAFATFSGEIDPADTNKDLDIYVHDRLDGTTERVSVRSDGTQVQGRNFEPELSANGHLVVFTSLSDNLVQGDTNGKADVFLHDRVTGVTRMLSHKSDGTPGDGRSDIPSISADGSTVIFRTWADNLQSTNPLRVPDMVCIDIASGDIESVHLNDVGMPANTGVDGTGFGPGHNVYTPVLSADGRFAAYGSKASNLVRRDTRGSHKIYRYDRLTKHVTLISRPFASSLIYGFDQIGSISADGSVVGFESKATNLVNLANLSPRGHVYVREVGSGARLNTIILTGPFSAGSGDQVELSWCAAPAGASYKLLSSFTAMRTKYSGHWLDLGMPLVNRDSGVIAPDGQGSWLSQPLPASLSGMTLYFELTCRTNVGQVYDSILHSLVVR